MRRKLFTLAFVLVGLALPGLAQSTQFNSDFISGAQCVPVPSSGLATGSYGVTGAWTGTLTAYGVVGQGSPVSLQSQTANGSYTVSIAGYTLFKVCGNSVASGAAFVTVYASITSSSSGGGVTVSGTPTNGQIAQWVSATAIQGILGLTFVSPTLTVSSAGNGNGCLALSGNTSGTATVCAPAVAGTSANPVAISNVLAGPSGSSLAPTYGFSSCPSCGVLVNGSFTVITAPDAQGVVVQTATHSNLILAQPTGISLGSGLISAGTKFTTNAGCTDSATAGGATAGTFTVASTSCTEVITMGNSATSPNGWSCTVIDITTLADVTNPHQTTSTTTTATIVTGTVVSGDKIQFSCIGY